MASDTPDRGGGRGDAAQVHDRARVVRRYLSALDMRRPGRTPARTSETISNRIHQVDTLLMSADPVQRLHLTQERIDLHAELLRLTAGATTDFSDAEAAFVRVVRSYSERHGITFSAWRQIGVDAAVLERAGIAASKPARPAKVATQQARPAPAPEPERQPEPGPVPKPEIAVAPPDPSCLDELPPVLRAAAPKAARSAATAAKKSPAANGAAKKRAAKPAGDSTTKRARAPKAKAEAVQQQLPADASS